MKVQKLSLAELKAKATNTNQNEVLEKVEGGSFSDCHGISGSCGKALIDASKGWNEFNWAGFG